MKTHISGNRKNISLKIIKLEHSVIYLFPVHHTVMNDINKITKLHIT